MKKVSLASLILASGLVVAACGTDEEVAKKDTVDEEVKTEEVKEEDKPTQKPASTYAVNDILDKVKASYGSSYLPNMPMDETMVAETFKLDMSLVEDFVAEMPTIGFHPDRVLIVKAKDGKIKQVVEQLEATREQMINDAMTYPANVEKIQSTKVISKDNYAAFFLVGSSENMAEDPEERLKFAENEVQKAVAAFNEMFK